MEDGGLLGVTRNGVWGENMNPFRYIKTYLEKNLSILWIALGLGCAYVTFNGMLLNNVTGIYPVEFSLVLRNLISTLFALVFFAIYRTKKRDRILSASRPCVVILGVALALSCLLRYSSHLFGGASDLAVFIGRIFELPLSILLIMTWAESITPRGYRASVVIYMLSLTWMAALQLVLSFFQHIPFMVLYSLLPLVSTGILAFAKFKEPSSEEICQDASAESFTPLVQLQQPSQFICYFGVLAIFTFIAGQILQETLSLQGNQFVCQLSIVLGNCVAAVILLSQARNLFNDSVHPKMILAITFLFSFALLSIMFSLSGTLDIVTLTLFLFLKSLFMQFVTILMWVAPFGNLRKNWSPMSIFSFGFACMMSARVLSSSIMLFFEPYDYFPAGLICCPALILAFLCCTASVVLVASNASQQGSLLSTQDFAHAGVKAPRPFYRAVALLAEQHGLTPQEEQVMALCAKGKNAQRVADEMVITVNTAKSHLRSIYAKVSVHSQQELITLVDNKVDDLRSEQEV